MKAPSLDNKQLLPILLVNFIGTLGYSIVLPFLVILVLRFGGNELIYGIMGATYSFFQLIGAPVLGNWSDKIGRKKVLLLSQVGTFLAWLLFLIALLMPGDGIMQVDDGMLGAFVITLPLIMLFAARALDGITGGNISVANAYLADISTESDRKQNFGKMTASANLGFIVGPTLAGLLGATALGDMLPVLLAMFISLVAIFVIAFGLKESNPCVLSQSADPKGTRKVLGIEQKECHKMAGEGELSFFDALKLKGIAFLLFIYFLIFLAFNFFYVAFPVHAIDGMQWSLFDLGLFFSTMGGLMVLVQGPVLAKLSKTYSDKKLLVAGSMLLIVGFTLFLSDQKAILFAAVGLFAAGNGIMWPSFLSILSSQAGEKHQGSIQGFASSVGAFASILGLIIGGFMYSEFVQYVFLIPAVFMAAVLICGLRLR